METIKWRAAISADATHEERARFEKYIESTDMVDAARDEHMTFLARSIGSSIAAFLDSYGASSEHKEVVCLFDLSFDSIYGRTQTKSGHVHTQNCGVTFRMHNGIGDGGSLESIAASDEFNAIATSAMREYVPNPKYTGRHLRV